ncbi:MAG: heavy-metal-associated domain-containing protein [Silvibacterium sp.]|nr:heavy-metal-associated domain-containing protein [Silvibacterium sp.]
MPRELKLSIDGMHCEGCVGRVTRALASVKGVRVDSVQVGSAMVEFEPALATPEEIAGVVDRIGFKAQIER